MVITRSAMKSSALSEDEDGEWETKGDVAAFGQHLLAFPGLMGRLQAVDGLACSHLAVAGPSRWHLASSTQSNGS